MKAATFLLLLFLLLSTGITGAQDHLYPKFDLESVEGDRFVSEDLKGKIVFLTFFAKGCEPCREEVPFLNGLQKKYPDTLLVLGVGFLENNPERLKKLGAHWGIEYPYCTDPENIAMEQFGIYTLPRGYLLDDTGKLVKVYEGMSPKHRKDLSKKVAAIHKAITK